MRSKCLSSYLFMEFIERRKNMTLAATVLDSILEVFTKIATWISSAVSSLVPMFYSAEGGLTFLGVLAVAGLSFAVIFLIIGIIQNFLHFRG